MMEIVIILEDPNFDKACMKASEKLSKHEIYKTNQLVFTTVRITRNDIEAKYHYVFLVEPA